MDNSKDIEKKKAGQPLFLSKASILESTADSTTIIPLDSKDGDPTIIIGLEI